MSQGGPALLPPLPGLPALSRETQEQIAALKVKVAALQQAISQGDEGAKKSLVALYDEHYSAWSQYCKNHVRPLIEAITEQENQRRIINEQLTSNLEGLRLNHEKLEQQGLIYQAQKENLAGIRGTQALIQEIDRMLEIELREQAKNLNLEADHRNHMLNEALKAIAVNIAQLRANKVEHDRVAFQLKKIYEAIPKPAGKFQVKQEPQDIAQAAKPQRRQFDIEDWILGKKEDPADVNSKRGKALLNGIFLRNLTQFLMTQEDVEAKKIYTTEELIRKYNSFTNPKLQGLDERIIIGIAVGYIRRSGTSPYCASHIQFLRDTELDPAREPIFKHFLTEFYAAFPGIAPAEEILANDPQRFDAIQQEVQQAVVKANNPRGQKAAAAPRAQAPAQGAPQLNPVNPKAAKVVPAQDEVALAPPPKQDLAYFDKKQEEVERQARAGQKAEPIGKKQRPPALVELQAKFDAENQAADATAAPQSNNTFADYMAQTKMIIKEMEDLLAALQLQLAQEKQEKEAEIARAKQMADAEMARALQFEEIAAYEKEKARKARKAQQDADERARLAQIAQQNADERARLAQIAQQKAEEQAKQEAQRAQDLRKQLQARLAKPPAPVVVMVNYGTLLASRQFAQFKQAYKQNVGREATWDDARKLSPADTLKDRTYQIQLNKAFGK